LANRTKAVIQKLPVDQRRQPHQRPHNRLSCKIEYFIQTTSADLSGRSAFFTDDLVAEDDAESPRRPSSRTPRGSARRPCRLAYQGHGAQFGGDACRIASTVDVAYPSGEAFNYPQFPPRLRRLARCR
jgi:hypothetical protein